MSELDDALSNPVVFALRGPQRGLGELRGAAARYAPQFALFAGMPLRPQAQDWADLATLCEPGERVIVVHPEIQPLDIPRAWSSEYQFHGQQMEGVAVTADPDPGIVDLGANHRPQMAGLVARTQPGPWMPRTAEMGCYVGFEEQGRLVAMAGERMRVPGATEISAVCTDPAWRGRGLAGRLVRALAARIQDRGERPVLHVSTAHENTITLYRRIGFTPTRAMRFHAVRLKS